MEGLGVHRIVGFKGSSDYLPNRCHGFSISRPSHNKWCSGSTHFPLLVTSTPANHKHSNNYVIAQYKSRLGNPSSFYSMLSLSRAAIHVPKSLRSGTTYLCFSLPASLRLRVLGPLGARMSPKNGESSEKENVQ